MEPSNLGFFYVTLKLLIILIYCAEFLKDDLGQVIVLSF